MLQIAAVFATLLGFSYVAGYSAVRYLGRGLTAGERMASMPLAGAALIGLVALWIHCFAPFRGALVYVSLLPVLPGAVLLAWDVLRGRLRNPGPFVPLLQAVGALLVLLPFIVTGGAGTVGLFNNDGFWWTQADHLVRNTTQSGALDSLLVENAMGFRRYGANYLSLIAQAITGLRSWETIHITAAFGTFLLINAGWLLTRTFRLWWPFALIAALGAAMNSYMYRTLLDAIIGFQFGFAWVLAVVALALRPMPTDWKPRAGLIALFLSAIGTYYTEFLLLVTGMTGAGLLGMAASRQLRLRQIASLAASGATGVILLGPLVVNIAGHTGFIAGFHIPVPLYRWDWAVGNFLHFTGMMDHVQYGTGPEAIALQYVGAVAILILLAGAIRYDGARRWLPLGAILLLLACAFAFFTIRRQEYTAHRFTVLMSPFLIVLLLAFLRPPRRIWMGIAAVVVLCASYPAWRMLSYLPDNYIRTTDSERQIGNEWMPKYVRNGRLLIDLPEDLKLFYGHYMYWEAMHGLGGDEHRIVYSGPVYSFVPARVTGTAEVTHILRRKDAPRAVGGKVVASNDRYELVELASPGAFVWVDYQGGFHGLEGTSRWLGQDGRLVLTAPRPLQVRFTSRLQASPRVAETTLTVSHEGTQLGQYPFPAVRWLEFVTPIEAGRNDILFHSSTPPLDPGNGDSRPMSVLLVNAQIQVSGR